MHISKIDNSLIDKPIILLELMQHFTMHSFKIINRWKSDIQYITFEELKVLEQMYDY